MKSISSFFIILFISISLFSQKKEDIIAKINNEPIFRSELEKNKIAIIEQYLEISPSSANDPDFNKKALKMAFDKILSETLIKQEAEKLKIKITDREIDNGIKEIKLRFSIDSKGNKLSEEETNKYFLEELKRQNITYEELREKVRKDLMAQKLVNENIKGKITPPREEELKNFYNNLMSIINNKTEGLKLSQEDREDYTNIAEKLKEMFSERIRLRHILIKPITTSPQDKNLAMEKIKKIRERILKGEDFEEIAQNESQDNQSAINGGDIGYVIRGMLPKEIEEIAFKLCPGEISDIIESSFGYHIIQVTEKRISQKIKYEIIKDELSNILIQQSFAKELQKYLEDLRKKAKIEIFDENLK